VLRAAGYRTGHFGKWHLGLMPEHRPDEYGFETSWHCAPDPGPPSYFSPYGVVPEGQSRNRDRHLANPKCLPSPAQPRSATSPTARTGEYITDRLTDEAMKFIDAHRDEPFYLNLWHYSVHGPWGHKEEYTAEFAKKTDPRGKQRNPIMASMLKSVDESLGRVLDKLDELKLTDNTLFIFYSDNGGNTHSNIPEPPKIGQNIRRQTGAPAADTIRQDWQKWAGGRAADQQRPLREGKGRIYEGGQRVPLMVRWPGRIEPGFDQRRRRGADRPVPHDPRRHRSPIPGAHRVDGLSFLPVLSRPGRSARRLLHVVSAPDPGVSVRAGDWKLIRRFEPHPDYPEGLLELYNLKDDLGETTNLAAKACPEKVPKPKLVPGPR
jgi:arylsulfatase A-like enzyme